MIIRSSPPTDEINYQLPFILNVLLSCQTFTHKGGGPEVLVGDMFERIEIN